MHLKKQDNVAFISQLPNRSVDLVYADIIFDNPNLSWVEEAISKMKKTGVIYIHTDKRSVREVRAYMDIFFEFQSWIIWAYNWGGRPRNKWANKHDDILFYSVSDKWPWYTEQVQIPKKTLINSQKTHQIPTDVWSDIGSLHTMSKEKDEGERRIWQKPVALTDRIMAAHLRRGKNQMVLDPCLGTGSALVSAAKYTQNLMGCDVDGEAVRVARKRVKQAIKAHWTKENKDGQEDHQARKTDQKERFKREKVQA